VGTKSHKKGRSLEDAVEMIERTILETDPSLANRTIRMVARRRLTIEGVRMEVDLWVELLGPDGYDLGGVVDFASAKVFLDGSPIDLVEYLTTWQRGLVEETVGRFPTISTPTGTYTTEGEATRKFARGAFSLDGRAVASVTLKVTPNFRVVWPTMVSSIEVEGRGRVVSLESVKAGDGEIRGALVALPRGERAADPPPPSPPKRHSKRTPARSVED
jgi:hypothetical protein